MKKLLFLIVLGLISNMMLLRAQEIINPVSATTTLTAEFGSSLDNTINGVGLDIFPTLSGTHEGTNPINSFLATNEAGTIDFDLGGTYLVDGLAFWNINAPGPGQTGIQDVVISSSQDGTTFTPISGSPSTFSQVMETTSPAEQFSFTEVTASFIRFDVMSNYGDPGNLVAFAEVAFSGVEVASMENVINPVSATTTLASAGTDLINTINGAGLAVFPSLSANHSPSNPGNSWISTDNAGTIDFDLGGLYSVDGLSFWNQNGGGPGPDGTTGIENILMYASEDGDTYTLIPESPETFAQVMTGDSPPEMFVFPEITASFIRIEVLTNYGDMFTGFAEIAFSGVPIVLEVSENIFSEAISLYPNPTNDVITISNTSNIKIDGIIIYDTNGRIVTQIKSIDNNYNQMLNVSALSSGIYMVHIHSKEGSSIKRVIKN